MKIFFRIVFFLILFTAADKVKAADFEYQKIIQIKENQAVASFSGNDNEEHFSLCNLADWSCAPQAQNINLYEEFNNQNFFVSRDFKTAIVIGDQNPAQLALYKNKNGKFEFLKNLKFQNTAQKILFTADNKKILIVTKSSGNFVVYDLEKDIVDNVVSFNGPVSFVEFSPDGNFLAFYRPNTQTRKFRKYAIINLRNNKEYSWTEPNFYWDLLTEEEKVFDFSPDGKSLVYLSDRGGYQSLYRVSLEKISQMNKKGAQLISRKYTVSNFAFGDSENVFYIANRKNPLIWGLYKYNLKMEELTEITQDVSYWPGLIKNGGDIYFLKLSEKPAELFSVNTKSDSVKKFPLENNSQEISRGEARNFNGIGAVIYKPDNFDKNKKYPLIVWLHGGPDRQVAVTFHPFKSYGVYDFYLLEKLRQNGYVILKVDYRGSYGYGKKFAEDLKNNIGKSDVKDVLNSISATQKEIKISNIYLMGNSYGGYLALRTLAEKPAIISGAISINGVTDWWTLINNDLSSIFGVHFKGVPSKLNKYLYDQASIFTRLKKIKDKKIMLVYGEEDGTIPNNQNLILADKLMSNDNFEMVSYPDEEHIFSKKANLENLFGRILEFVK